MPRPKNPRPKTRKVLYLDSELTSMTELLITVPGKLKPKQGAFAALVEQLMREYIAQRRKEYQNDNVS